MEKHKNPHFLWHATSNVVKKRQTNVGIFYARIDESPSLTLAYGEEQSDESIDLNENLTTKYEYP